MKSLSSGMASHVEGGSQKLAWALQVTRTDAEVFRYVAATRSATLDGNEYTAAPGFNVSSITCTLGFNVDTLNLTILNATELEQADFLAGRWHGARIEFNQYNWADPTDGFIPWPTYKVANVEPIVGGFVLEARDLRQLMRQDYTLSLGKTCSNRLGDSLCTIDLADYTHAFTLTSVTSRTQVVDTGLTQDAGYFTGGYIVFDDGLHAGLKLLIRDHNAGGILRLARPLVDDAVIGQTGIAVAGCRKRHDPDCRDKFNNVINFRGARHAPSTSKLAGT